MGSAISCGVQGKAEFHLEDKMSREREEEEKREDRVVGQRRRKPVRAGATCKKGGDWEKIEYRRESG
jgi:hypothetical protein